MKRNYFSYFLPGLIWLLPRVICAQTQIANFGSNPGNITAYQYVPASMPANAPLVLVLHGCTQTAASYGLETGWNTLADRHKFYVAYAQQSSANNSLECFNYYVESDINPGGGEALSIKQITDYMKSTYSIDSTRVFVTGLSAGGAMTCVMCCAYPDVFAAGAEMSGLAYKVAIGETAADLACLVGVTGTAQQWGDSARAQNPGYTGNWPRMAIFHGTADDVVNNENASQVIEQFTNLHGCSQTPGNTIASFNGNSLINLEQFFDANNQLAVEYYAISNMAHGTAVYPGNCYQQGGTADNLAFDEEFYSPFWAASFFGILQLSYGITGPNSVNIDQQGVVYSVPDTAGTTYTWSVPPGVTIVSGQGTSSITVNWDSLNGTISVTELSSASGACELGPAQLFVSVNGQQTTDAGLSNLTAPASSLCQLSFTPAFTLNNAGSTTLTSVSIDYTIDAGSWQTYNWTGTLASGQSTAITLPVQNVSTGNHTLTIFCTSPNGGNDSNLSNDTIHESFTAADTPVIPLRADTTQCGGSVTLNASNAGDTYAWSTGASSQTIAVSQSGAYSVTVTSYGCSASAGENVTIGIPPVIAFGGDTIQCGTLQLNAQNAGDAYAWSTGASTQTIAIVQSGVYTVTISNTGCTATASENVTITPGPALLFGGDTSQCGGSITLDAQNTGDTYLWSTGAVSQTITVSQSGAYAVTVSSGSCSVSASEEVNFGVQPVINLPDTTICGDTLLLDAQNSGDTYVWSTGAITQTIAVTLSGYYTVTVSSYGCSASASVNVTVNTPPCGNAAIADVNENTEVSVFPNPVTDGNLHISITSFQPGMRLQVFDIRGCLMSTLGLTSAETDLGTAGLAPGAYMLKIERQGATLQKKFVVE